MTLMPSKLSFPMFNPKDCKESLEAAGIKIVGISSQNHLFYVVKLPDDWTIQTDGGLWTYYFDASGAQRFAAFYKHEAWDERAFLQVS